MQKKKKIVDAWHVLPNDKKLKYGDRRMVGKNRWMKALVRHDLGLKCTKPVLCVFGMHAAISIMDAAVYMQKNQNSTICRVQIKGDIATSNHKICGMHRKVISWGNSVPMAAKFHAWLVKRAINNNTKMPANVKQKILLMHHDALAKLHKRSKFDDHNKIICKIRKFYRTIPSSYGRYLMYFICNSLNLWHQPTTMLSHYLAHLYEIGQGYTPKKELSERRAAQRKLTILAKETCEQGL